MGGRIVYVYVYVCIYFISSGRKRVELLLQHMFEGEIDPNDDGSDFDLEQVALLSQQRPRKLTLDNVT